MKALSKITCATLIFLLILFSCNENSDILSRDRMIGVLTDMHVANSIGIISGDTSIIRNKKAILKGVLEKHNITTSQMDRSIDWYSDNVRLLNEINDSVVARLTKEAKIINTLRDNELMAQSKYGNYDIMPNVLFLNSQNHLFRYNLSNNLSTANSTWENFEWSFNVQGLSAEHNLKARIFFKYSDTTIIDVRTIDLNQRYVFEKPRYTLILNDSIKDSIPDISGYIRLQNFDKNDLTIINIYNMSHQSSTDTTIISKQKVKTDELLVPTDVIE